MSGIPDVKVETYNSAYGWWDISDAVLLDEGIRMKRGRASQFDTSSPGTCSLTLTVGVPADTYHFGIGSLNVGVYLQKNTPIRITIDAIKVWEGFIDSVTWRPGVATKDSTIEVTCTDEFKKYAKMRLAPFGIETPKAATAWTGGAIYPLATQRDGVGSFWAAHRDPAADPIRIYGGTAGHVEVDAQGPPYIGSAVRMVPWSQIGPVYEHPTTWNPASEYGLVSFWFRTEVDETAYLFSMERTSGGTGYFYIYLNATTGRLTFAAAGDSGGSVSSTPSIPEDLFDGQWHHVAAWLHPDTGGTRMRFYIDGSLQTTAYSATAITIGSSNRRAVFGGKRNAAWTDNSYCMTGELAAPAVFIKSSSVTDIVADWYGDGMDGDADQTVANRLTDLASFVDAPSVSTANLSGYQIAGQNTDGRSYLDCVQEIASTEMGVFYIDRFGDPKLRGFGARSSGSSVTVTVSATQDLAGNFEFVLDDATHANTVLAKSPNGSVLVQDSSLVTAEGVELVDRWETLTYSESNLTTMADNRLDLLTSATPRIGRITVDLLTTPNSIQSTVLQLVPLDRVRVSNLDTNVAGATTYDGFVEGWEVEVSTSRFTCSLDLSPVV